MSYNSTVSVDVNIVARNSMRTNVDCPGDTIEYNCTVLSNSPTPNLIWRVTVPGLTTMNITHDNISDPNTIYDLGMNISSFMTNFMNGSIESIIVLTMPRDIPMNGTKLECATENLQSYSETLIFHQSGIEQNF